MTDELFERCVETLMRNWKSQGSPRDVLETIPETPIVKTPFDLSNREHLNLVLQAALEVWGPEEVWRVEDGKVRLFKSTARGLKGKEVPTPEEVRAIFSNYKAE